MTDLDDARLLQRLLAGDEDAFMRLVERYGPSMLRVATSLVRSRSVAEEVVQDTWVAVLRGIERFEGRSSLKTWLFRILVNRARSQYVREARSIPISALTSPDDEGSLDADGLLDGLDPATGWWIDSPRRWSDCPVERLLSAEADACVRAAIDTLPPAQRRVIELRDVDGFSAPEVCDLLELSEGNQRVLLHRARTRVRRAIDAYLAAAEAPAAHDPPTPASA
jgi:RNA polymerase sigma-70 factor (ECF subfamily)